MPDFTGDLGNKILQAVGQIPGIEAPMLQTIKDEITVVLSAESSIEDKAIAAGVSAEDKLIAAMKPVTDLATVAGAIMSQMSDGKLRLVLKLEQV